MVKDRHEDTWFKRELAKVIVSVHAFVLQGGRAGNGPWTRAEVTMDTNSVVILAQV